MNAFILTEGGRGVGFGHMARCKAICEAFKEKEIFPVFIINDDSGIRSALRGEKNIVFDWLKEKKKLFKIISGADAIIIDSYLASFDLYNKISKIAKLGVYIDDNNRISYPRGAVVNGSIYAKGLRYPARKDILYLLGMDYVPLRKEFWNATTNKINKNVKSVMVTFGGDDIQNMTPKVLKVLSAYYPRLIKNIVIGSGFKSMKAIKKIKDKNTRLIIEPDAKEMKRLMLGSDIAISAGGQTLYELARIGIPAIVVAIAGNQLNNIKAWRRTGFIEYAGWHNDDSTLRRLRKHMGKLFEYDKRILHSRNGRKFNSANGAGRIADAIVEAIQEKV